MYCPRCGEAQTLNQTRFCSKCGLELAIVSELVKGDGTLPQLSELDKKTPVLTKKKGVALGVTWVILFIFLAAFASTLDSRTLPELFALTGIFGGLLISFLSLVFLPSGSKRSPFNSNDFVLPAALPNFQAPPPAPQLNPQEASQFAPPMAGAWKAPETGEISTPASVVDSTTRLLKKDR